MMFRGNPLSQDSLCIDVPALTARGVSGFVGGRCGEPGPLITRQPAGGWVEVGQSHTFSVEVAATGGATYRWRKDGFIVGLSYPELIIASVSAQDTGWYTCLVLDDNGTAMSQSVHLQVVPEGSLPAAGGLGLLSLVGMVIGTAVVVLRRGACHSARCGRGG